MAVKPAGGRLGILSALLLALIGCANSKPKPDEPEVKSLRIEGTKHVSEGELKDRILTSESSWWPFSEKQYFDSTAWQADLRRLIRIYQANGYFNARILEQQIIPDPPDAVRLRVRVEEGPPTIVRELQYLGFDALPESQRLSALADLPIQQGAIFKEVPWDDSKSQTQRNLRQMGYAEAVVNGVVLVDVSKNEADLKLNSIIGQRYRFGDVFVSTNPNPHAPASWIREQAEGAVKKGSWYSDSAMAEAQARVFKMGVFGGVKVTAGAPDRQVGTIPVVVDVRESPFHTVRLGGGAGIDQVRNEVRLLGEYTDRDFYGGLRKFTLRGKIGWAFLPNLVTVISGSQAVPVKSEPIYKASADFEQPRALFNDVKLTTGLESQRDAEQAYSFIGGRGRLGLIWQPTSTLSISPTYNLEVDYVLSGQTTLGGQAPELFYGCPEVNCLVVLSYLEQAIIWDRRDDIADPRKGFYLAFAIQEGGGPLGGSYTYLKITPEARYYISFPRDERYTIAMKLRLGTLWPLGSGQSSPIVTRFFSGGDFMRGFNYRRLSPMALVASNPSQSLDDGIVAPAGLQGITVPIGGNGLYESSVEFRYTFPRTSFVLAGFLDTGFVTTDDVGKGLQEQGFSYFTKNMQYALGVGMRYRTPIGPLRFDLARRLNIGPPLSVTQSTPPVNPPSAQGGFFGLTCGPFCGQSSPGSAGYPEGVWSFHFSVGESF